MSALRPYLPWLAWTFVPQMTTDFTLKLLYTSSLLPRPQDPGTAVKYSSRVRALLVGGYLVWSFYTTLATREPSAYELLALNLDASVEQVKKAFRRMAMIYHPDKVGAQGEKFFIALRRSHDVLSDPVKRFAYDRFGFGVLNWKDAISYREHMVIGLRSTMLFYIFNSLIYTLISWLSSDRMAFSFWHLTFLFALVVTEINIIIQPHRPVLMQILMPNTTVHDTVLLLHQTYTSSTMAARQLLPFLSFQGKELIEGPKTFKDATALLDSLAAEMNKLKEMASAVETSTQSLWEADVQPLYASSSDNATIGQLEGPPTSTPVRNNGSPFELNEMQQRYARLTSDALLVRSVEGVAPDFKRQLLLSKSREEPPQPSILSLVSQNAVGESATASSVEIGHEQVIKERAGAGNDEWRAS